MLRLKVKTIRSLLWLGNLVVICGIALLVWQAWVWQSSARKTRSGPFALLSPDKIEKAIKVNPTIEATTRSTGQDFELLKSCWELNLTGKEPPKPVERDPEQDNLPTSQPITDVLRVDMVYVDTPATSCATVRYLADGLRGVPPATQIPPPRDPTKKREKAKLADEPVHVGDELREPYNKAPFLGKVVDITSDGVMFSWCGKDELVSTQMLTRPDEPPKLLPGLEDDPVAEAERAKRAESMRVSRKLHNDGWFIGTEERDTIIENHESILKEIGLGSEHSEEKGRRLIKLIRIPEDSLVAQRGFEVNDLIYSINGEEISSKAAAIQYFKLHPTSTTFNVEIERRGQRITKVFQIAR